MKKNIFKFIFIAILTVLPSIGQNANAQVPANCPDVMLQAFDYYPQPINVNGTTLGWNDSKWTTLNTQAAEIGASFQMIWLPPSGNAGPTQTMGYLPIYWFDQNSSFGAVNDLKTLIGNLKTNNCKAIADIVINHRNGISDWCTFPTESYKGVTYTPNSSWICTDDESRASAPAGCNNPQGNADEGEKYSAARDLDHKNSGVQAAVKAYLDFLKNEIGYAGWRYDVAAGYAPSHIGDYDDSAAGYYSVGEVMNCDYTAVETWINGTSKKSTAFDFPFQCSVRDAFNGGDLTKLVWKFLGTTNQPAGLIHNPDLRRYATTFIENHDTYRYGLGFYGNIEAANAFMLSSPGVPCVYFPHWKAYKANIQKMIAARKKAGVHSQSAVTVLQTASNIYVGQVTGINGTLIVKVGSGSYSAPAGYTQECSGTDWCIWTKVSGTPAPTLIVDKVGGTYLGGTTVTLSSTGGTPTVKIYYTTDGSTPTALPALLYSTPISITMNNTVLKAIAIDGAGLASAVAINTYVTAVAPVLVVTNPGGTYIGGTTVTLSSTGGQAPVKIYFTTNGTTPTALPALLYSAPISITANNTVLKAVAVDNSGVSSAVATHTYVTVQPVGLTVCFTAPANWAKVYCYAWKGTNTTLAGAWPGTDITSSSVGGVYSFVVTDIATLPVNFVFNNNNNNEQTVDLSTSANICWSAGSSTGTAPKKYACVVIACKTSLAEQVTASKLKIYPNPARESITVESELNLESIQIYSINGLLVKSVLVNSNSQIIPIGDLVAGYYSVVAITENGAHISNKLIKQ